MGAGTACGEESNRHCRPGQPRGALHGAALLPCRTVTAGVQKHTVHAISLCVLPCLALRAMFCFAVLASMAEASVVRRKVSLSG